MMENISDWLPQSVLLLMFGIGGYQTVRKDGNVVDFTLGLGMVLGLLWWGGFFG